MKTGLLKECGRFSPIFSLILATTSAGCSDTSGPDPVLLEIVEGDGQEAEVATHLAGLLVVQVTGVDGLPRSGVRIEWIASEGGGSIEPDAVLSDEGGLASARWTLGPEPGTQSVIANARGTTTSFRALATPPPPADWAELLEIRPGARVEGTELLASVWLLNRWPGTVRLYTPSSCLIQPGYPALYSTSGEQVAYWSWGCWAVLTRHTIAPGDSLYRQWELGIASVGSGEFTLRFRFAVQDINGRPATLPDTMMTVVIGG
ncbi:MAG: hypothetical protein ABIF09_03150 [Gemmatimonadota bacterium]